MMLLMLRGKLRQFIPFEPFPLQVCIQPAVSPSTPSVSDGFPLLAPLDLYQNAVQPKLITNTAADI